jgi:molecular chaperone DnaK (HSP70)
VQPTRTLAAARTPPALEPPAPLPIVAAIDFGTHGSGFAWARVRELEQDPNTSNIKFRDRWPGTDVNYPKNLSALMLDGEEVQYWGFEAKSKWARAMEEGPAQNHDLSYVYAFKMALKPSRYADSLPRGLGRIKVRTPLDAYPLIVAYLQKIQQVALEAILETGYKESQIRWCVTIPAIWDAADRTLMHRAAVEAGFPDERMFLVQEPEAAALQCRVHMDKLAADSGNESPQYDLRSDGARFMVVDCGGGTVDITAYRVNGPPGSEQKLMDLCRASGGKLGSENINRAFAEKVLPRHFGGQEVVNDLWRLFPHDMLEIIDTWEQRKVTLEVRVDDSSDKPKVTDSAWIPVPGLVEEYARSRRGESGGHRIIVEPAEIEELFEEIVPKVLKEIEGRLEEVRQTAGPPPSGREILLLVGGFAASRYLQARIRLHFADRVAVVVPDRPAAAVMFGAVRFCHRPWIIWARCSRYTYGYAVYMPFQEGIDDGQPQAEDDQGKLHCSRFSRLVKIGESVEVGKATTTNLLPLRRSHEKVGIRLLASTEPDPRYPDEPQVVEVGSISVDISESVGQPISERNFILRVHFGETEIRAECRNPRTGNSYKVAVDFEYQ